MGRILDISLGGARLLLERCPRPHGALWVHLKAMAPSDWIEVRLLEWAPKVCGDAVLRVCFLGSCPYATFTRVVWGDDVLAAASPTRRGG
jgi:hypothetical protein